MDTEALYSELENALASVGAEMGAAEAHGLLCGMKSAQEQVDRATWIAQVLENTAPKGGDAQNTLVLLTQLYDQGGAALEDPDMTFEPLLPRDDAPMAERAGALAQWCQGFLLGLSLAGISGHSDLGRDINELLRDFTEITQVEPDPVAEEANESAYAELVEYVRVGTLVILEHLRPKSERRRDGRPNGEKSPKRRTLH